MKALILIFTTLNLFGATVTTFAQSSPPSDWFLRDPEMDHVQGVSVERAYETFLKGQPSRTILVAVIDTGVDIEHEELKKSIWTNVNEIPGNGIDDDHNGYIDDVHGWNFIGGKNGNVTDDTGEITREYIRLHKIFSGVEEQNVKKKQRSEFENYKRIKSSFEKARADNQREYELYRSMYGNLKMSLDTLKATLHTDRITASRLDSFKTSNPTLLFAKGFVTRLLRRMGDDENPESALAELADGLHHYQVVVDYNYNPDFNSREIVGDDDANLRERSYGNNDVIGPDPEHGTHVAGIIAADRANDKGIRGIADHVIIMPIRTVPPNGDERDKDVANAIRYAVDNGARIINMSFGKSYSPGKEVVDEAVRYAEQKGVLLVHAAGNDGQDIDRQPDYPSRNYLNGKQAYNWLEVGSSGWGAGENLVARFSNYGQKNVDFFAPGADIYSSVPGNKYKEESGTSMSSPVAAGVAALVMSYFPSLTTVQIHDVLVNSSRKFDGLKVHRPKGGKVDFTTLSRSGGLINAYEAVRMAKSMQASMEVK